MKLRQHSLLMSSASSIFISIFVAYFTLSKRKAATITDNNNYSQRIPNHTIVPLFPLYSEVMEILKGRCLFDRITSSTNSAQTNHPGYINSDMALSVSRITLFMLCICIAFVRVAQGRSFRHHDIPAVSRASISSITKSLQAMHRRNARAAAVKAHIYNSQGKSSYGNRYTA